MSTTIVDGRGNVAHPAQTTAPPTDADRLAVRAIELLSTLSPTNLRRGSTPTVTVWREHVNALAAEVARQYPGWLAAVQADRKAAGR